MRPTALFGMIVLGLVVTSCGSYQQAGVSELTISGAWARPTPSGSTVGAVYLTIESPVDDEIIGVEAAIAGDTSVNESTSAVGGGSHEGHSHGGSTMKMIESDGRLTKDEPLVMAPGGMHIMLEGLSAPLKTGDEFDLTLQFAVAGTRTVSVRVSANPPGD